MSKNGKAAIGSTRVVRGLIFGLISGALFMAIALAVASLVLPMPQPRAVVEPQAIVAQELVQPTVETPEETTPTPQMTVPTMDDAPVLDETTSAIMPDAGNAESALSEVSSDNETAPAVSGGDMPSAGAQPTTGLTEPMSETDLAISAEPAQPAAPAVDEATFEEAPVDVTVDAPIMIAEEDAEEEEDTVSTTLAPDEQLSDDSGVVVNRLPTVADTGQATSGGPLVLNAEAFDNPENRPVMSIVLIDTGEFNIGYDALASFPYPITFAIDPLREDALEKAAAYRERGFELLAVVDLPSNGGEELADLALLPTLNSVSGLVGVLEGTGEGLQGNMELSEGVLRMVDASGYGLLLRSKGLNAAQQMAEGRGLPVETVFRDFDANGQDASIIRRFLDQAAFKARQEGSIVKVGRLRPATISALLLWGLQDRASSVALAPVSAVLSQ